MTVDELQEWLQNSKFDPTLEIVRPPFVCPNGFRFSIQASEYHCSTPKNTVGPWTHLEIMLMGVIHEYVPIEQVVMIINSHNRTVKDIASSHCSRYAETLKRLAE